MVFFPSPDIFHRLLNLLKIQRSLYNSLETFQKGEIVTKKNPTRFRDEINNKLNVKDFYLWKTWTNI